MAYTVKTTSAPGALAIDLADVKSWARVDGSDDDDLLTRLIKTATDIVERHTGRALVTQTRQLVLDRFPVENDLDAFGIPVARRQVAHRLFRGLGAFYLPYAAPLQSVSSITYLDTDATSQTLAASKYRVDDDSEPAFVAPAENESWPLSLQESGSVVVEYICGYGDASSDVPDTLKQAIAELARRMFDRECMGGDCMDAGAKDLVRAYRIWIG